MNLASPFADGANAAINDYDSALVTFRVTNMMEMNGIRIADTRK